MATLASIGINITGDSKELSNAITSATAKMESFAQKAGQIGQTLSTRLTLPIVGAGALMVKAFTEQEDAVARLTAGLRANGGQAGVTSKEIIKLAGSLQKVTTFGDEATISAAALLTTFHQIRNVAGEGNDVFNRTIIAAQDLASAMGTDLQSATMQLAKALENPTIGLGALSRTGTTFTEQQKEMIKTLVESGRTLDAQKMILEVVESQYKGTARTIADTTSGQIKRAFNELGDEMEEFGRIISDSLIPLIQSMTGVVRAVSAMDESTKRVIVTIAGVTAAIGPALISLGLLTKAFIALRAATIAHPILAIATAIGAIGTAAYLAMRNVSDLHKQILKQVGIEGELTGAKEEQAKLHAKIVDLSRELAKEQRNLATLGMDAVEERIRSEKRVENLRAQTIATTELLNESRKLGQVFEETKELQGLQASAKSIARVTTELRMLDETFRDDFAPRIREMSDAWVDWEDMARYATNAINAMGGPIKHVSLELVIARQLAESFTSSFGAGIANVIVQGERLTGVLKNIGKLLLSSAIQQGLRLLLLGPAGFGVAGGGAGIIGSLFGGVSASPVAGSALTMDGAFKLQGTDLVLAINRSERTFR